MYKMNRIFLKMQVTDILFDCRRLPKKMPACNKHFMLNPAFYNVPCLRNVPCALHWLISYKLGRRHCIGYICIGQASTFVSAFSKFFPPYTNSLILVPLYQLKTMILYRLSHETLLNCIGTSTTPLYRQLFLQLCQQIISEIVSAATNEFVSGFNNDIK